MKNFNTLLNDDVLLDRSIKIQGTEFDRKRKLTDRQVTYAKKLLNRGYPVLHVAKIMGVAPLTIKYNTDPEFREAHLRNSSGKHTGIDTVTRSNRVNYKKQLLADGKVTV